MRSLIRKQSFFYANLVLLFFLLNGFCSRSACRLDLSRDQINSVSKSTARIFQSLKEPVLLEAYVSKDVTGEITSEIQPILGILYEMERVANDKLRLRVYNPNTEELRNKARERGIRGIPITQQKEIEASVRLGYFGVYLQKGEKSALIPLVDQNWFINDLEYRILREIRRFERSDKKSGVGIVQAKGAPDIYAWTRPQDQSKDNFYGFKTNLGKELGAIDDVSLEAPVPAKIQILLLMGLPQLELMEAYHLDQFLLRGGNLICMLGAFKFEMRAGDPRLARLGLGGTGASLGMATVPKEELEALNAWLAKYGITLRNEILFEPKQAMPVWDFQGQFPRQILYPAWALYARKTGNIVGKHPALESIEQLVFPWFSSLDLQEAKQPGLKFQILVRSSPQAISRPSASLDYIEVQKTSQNAREFLGRQAPLAVLASGKFKSAYPSLKDLPKGADRVLHLKEQAKDTSSHLAVIGTPYMVSDILLRNQLGTSIFRLNNAFLLNLIEAVTGDSELAAARSRQRTLSTIIVKSKLLQNMISWGFSLILPLALGLWGAWRLKERNKKRAL